MLASIVEQNCGRGEEGRAEISGQLGCNTREYVLQKRRQIPPSSFAAVSSTGLDPELDPLQSPAGLDDL
jgi:hypothetical protein